MPEESKPSPEPVDESPGADRDAAAGDVASNAQAPDGDSNATDAGVASRSAPPDADRGELPAAEEDRVEAESDPTETSTEAQPYFVGLGASAGGLEALEQFFDAMPSDSGLAFVVVQHLSPDYKSLMAELLAKHTKMPVAQATDGQRVLPNQIYLIPPKKNMLIYHGKLLLTEQDYRHGINLPIDVFLRSLAEDHGERSVGIIFSGTGSDGMRGVRAIKEAGGMVMVQDEESAKFDGMPRSAISTGLADFILPPDQMPEQLMRYITRPHAVLGERQDKPLGAEEDNLSKIVAVLRRQSGVDFAHYKPSTVVRRIERRMNINQVEELGDYVRYLYHSPREVNSLFKELLIGVTSFFRDNEAWEIMRTRVLPELFENLGEENMVRAWVAGCSTGEEAYSLAMLLQEQGANMDRHVDIKVFATDIDRDAIEFASNGVYPESVAADLTTERLSRFFVKRGDSYQINRQIRESVIFATQNILKDPPFTKIDVLSCRNLLIYLQPPLQKKILSLFRFALRPGGFLFLGSSETVGDFADQFETVDTKWKLYRSRGGSRPSLADTLHLAPVHERIQQIRGGGYARRHDAEEEGTVSEKIYQALLADYVPVCVVVNEAYEVIHIFGDVKDYMQFRPGRASLQILKMVHKELSIALTTAIHRAAKEKKDIIYRDVRFQPEEGEPRSINIRIKPIERRRGESPLFAIFFEPGKAPEPVEAEQVEAYSASASSEQRIGDLEQELQYTKENLQATIEELETSNEELQATNEELLAANEELQSTNEELQSVNEELYTVNAEYQNKIQELTELNNDMDNLLLSTDIGTLFLDGELRVRKFTPPVARVLNLLPQDIGRPIRHISHNMEYDDLLADACQVLADRISLERGTRTLDGRQILIRLAPYRAEEQVVGRGVVVTFTDISEVHKVQQELAEAKRMTESILATVAVGICVTDEKGVFANVNDAYCQIYGYDREALLGQHFSMICRPEQREAARILHDEFIAGAKEIPDEWVVQRKDGQAIRIFVRANLLKREDGRRFKVTVVEHLGPADDTRAGEADQDLNDAAGR